MRLSLFKSNHNFYFYKMEQGYRELTTTEKDIIWLELYNVIREKNEIKNLVSLERIQKLIEDVNPKDLETKSIHKKLDEIKEILSNKPQSVQIEFDKVIKIMNRSPIQKIPYVVVIEPESSEKRSSETSVIKKRKTTNRKRSKSIYVLPKNEDRILTKIMDILKEREKQKDEKETSMMRRLSTEKEKDRLSRYRKSREKTIRIKSKIQRYSKA